MDKTFKQIIDIIKNTIKVVLLPLLPWILLILAIVILLASFVYFITVDDGTYKESDWSNVPYGVSSYTNDIKVNANGSISSSMTAEELWDKLIENGSDIDQYLDSPEELKKLINAQIVTQYPDIRKDTSVPIDWSKIDVNNPPGIVKFIRSDTSNNKQNMQYVEPDKFQSYVDEYNKTGNQQAKENALKSFTIETKSSSNNSESYKVDSLNNFLFIGDSLTDGLSNANIISNVTFKAVIGVSPSYWLDHFSELPTENIEGVCVLLGINDLSQTDKMQELIDKLIETYDGKPVYVQKVFPVTANNSYSLKKEDIDKYNNEIKEYCNSKQGVYFIDTTSGYEKTDGSLDSSKAEADGLHLKDFNTWAKNIENAIVSSNNNSNTSSNIQSQTDELFWPTDLTDITSNYGDRDGEFHNGIDIKTYNGSDTVGNPVYACEEGTVKYAQWSNSAGNWIVIDHGNGYTSEYMHNSSLEVSAGEKVKKGQRIAVSGNTGQSQGVHLHFEINKDEQSIDPLSFKYSNGQGSGTGGFGNYSTAQTESNSSNTEILVKVATWTETTHIEENTDPELQDKNSSETKYSMTTQSIQYQNLVSGYTMPFEFLWALLVIGEDKDFVLALADLVYGSDIEITIHDSLTIDTQEKVYTYNKNIFAESKGSVLTEVKIKNPNNIFSFEEKGSWVDDISDKSYTTKTTDITKTNTLEIALTRANVWIVDYKKEYDWQNMPKDVQSGDPQLLNNIVEDEPFDINNDDKFGHIEELKSIAKEKIEEYDVMQYEFSQEQFEAKYYKKIYNRKERITNTTEGNKYIASPETITEKTDKEGKNGPNFVTLFNNSKYAKNKSNILSVPDWLFEILEANDSTKEMVDLMKYLLYKATETNYGVTEYDFEIFKPESFTNVGMTTESPIVEFIKSYENEPLWLYQRGDSSISYSSVEAYVSEDGKKYKMYYTKYDKCLNFSFGIMVYSYKDDTYNNESYFKDEGIDLKALIKEYNEGKEVYVDKEIIDRIMLKEIQSNRERIGDKLEKDGIRLKDYQLDALASVAYQYGNAGEYGEFQSAYRNYYEKGDHEGFRKNVITTSTEAHYFSSGEFPTRQKNTWKLFEEGIYIANNGEEIKDGGNTVVTYALQFVGEGHSRFTSYFNKQADWCAMFVSYCYKQCGLIPEVLKETYLGCTAEVNILKSRNEFIDASTGYVPKPGDIIFFKGYQNGVIVSPHTGIVTSSDGIKVYTVEGNTGLSTASQYWAGSKVLEKDYFINDNYIYGYFTPSK